MTSVFLSILNMSFTASIVVIAVILLRFALKCAPKWITVLMWALVAIRLVLPFSFESVFSLIPSSEPLPTEIIAENSFNINTGVNIVDRPVNEYLDSHYYEGVTVPSDNGIKMMDALSIVWLCGIAAMVIYAVASYIKMRIKVREAIRKEDNIYLCDSVATPFILGFIMPRIYLPSGINSSDAEYVIAHEKAHIKRLDHIIKPFSFALLCVYWFNPLIWIAYILLCRDIEFACDERVIKQSSEAIKVPYSEALISCALPRRSISACPLAFGEVGVKSRIKGVLSYKKPAFWIIIAAVIAIIISSVCLLTNPTRTKIENIENLSLDTAHETTYIVYLTVDGQSYKSAPASIDRELIKDILQLKVSGRPASQNRSEDREAPNRIVLADERTLAKSILSSLYGTQICFNADFTEVFIYSEVKPTLSYRVLNSREAKRLFNELQSKITEFRRTTSEGVNLYRYSYKKLNSSGNEIDNAEIILDKDSGTYQFNYSLLSSYIANGHYEETDSELILHDDKYVKYTFKKSGFDLIFDAENSSQMAKYKYSGMGQPEVCVPDGAVFSIPDSSENI